MRTIDDITRELEAQYPEEQPLVHRGWEFSTPFHCFYCGVQISAHQFAFARACGGCDVSESRTRRLSPYDRRAFTGPHKQVGQTSDHLFINPQWLDPATREQYPVLHRPRVVPPHKPLIPPSSGAGQPSSDTPRATDPNTHGWVEGKLR